MCAGCYCLVCVQLSLCVFVVVVYCDFMCRLCVCLHVSFVCAFICRFVFACVALLCAFSCRVCLFCVIACVVFVLALVVVFNIVPVCSCVVLVEKSGAFMCRCCYSVLCITMFIYNVHLNV